MFCEIEVDVYVFVDGDGIYDVLVVLWFVVEFFEYGFDMVVVSWECCKEVYI